jgi:DNA-binding FadR family transcriptional regulator
MLTNAQIYQVLKEIYELDTPAGAMALSMRLDISQATIGRQLLYLEEHGLIKKVSNKGRILTSKGIEQLRLKDMVNQKIKIANELVSISSDDGRDSLLEIMEVRKLLECRTAELASLNATEADIQELEDYAFTHRYNLNQGKPANQQDLSFHLTIARNSGNQTIFKILDLLLTAKNAYVKFSEAGDSDKNMQVVYHFKILNAIKEKNPVMARQAMNEHLCHIVSDVEKYFK